MSNNIEEAIRQTGWGLYHQFLIGIAAACAFSNATALMSVSFALPIAACDISLSEDVILAVNVCLSIGMAVGGFILGCVSDLTGRKCMIPTTLILIFGSSFAIGFSHGQVMILLCAFLLGTGLVANYICMRNLLAESLPLEKRGFYLIFPDVFWTAGYITTAGALSIMTACTSALLQQSPRFLLLNEKYTDAMTTLKYMYAVNNSRHCDSFKYPEENLRHCIDDFNLNVATIPRNCSEQFMVSFCRIYRSIMKVLDKKSFLRLSLLFAAIKLTMGFGIASANIWLSSLLNNYNHTNCSIDPLEVFHVENHLQSKCKFNSPHSPYKDFILLAGNIFVGQVVLLIVIDRIGRKVPLVSGCISCAIASLILAFVDNFYIVRLIFSSIFMIGFTVADVTVNCILIEAYPTAIRGTAAGGTQIFPRIISGIVKRYFFIPCQYSFITMAALMAISAALGYFLPDLRKQPLVES